jgi:Arc/MetJ-type ribon-helix-helix transcriptional regulator
MAASFDRHPRYALTTPSINKRKMKQGKTAMDVTLPADLRTQVDQELASGHYRSRDELIEQAVRHFFEERQRGQQRLDALRRIGQAVDQAGLYERVLIPDQQ